MSSLQSVMSSNSNAANFDEQRWIINIRRTLDEERENDEEIPVCIFNVPKSLMVADPDSYVPREVAIGPYHYWRPGLCEMERYKLAAAKRTQKQLHSLKFEHIVDQLMHLEPKIRACYHKSLDLNGETLAWMMAIDATYLLEFLQICAIKEGKTMARVSSSMSHLVDYGGTKSAHNAILRDMVMLENQIPMFVLRKMLEVQFPSLEMADDLLLGLVMGFCKELSPFRMMQDIPNVQISQSAHLLDYLYDMVVPKVEAPSEIPVGDDQIEAGKEEERPSGGKFSYAKDLLAQMWNIISTLNRGPVKLLKRLLCPRPVRVMVKLLWSILSNLPGFSILKQPVQYIFFSKDKKEIKPQNSNSNNDACRPPLVEEITIPSVSELSKSGVYFVPTTGNILSISFDVKAMKLYLPIVSLDVNTEVVLRNLVAYEASNATGPLVLTRYTEFMNGIIDTAEDAKLLRERGIILNHLKSDEEVANFWNGMSRSIRLTKVPFLDKVIEDVNKYHSKLWRVKVGKVMKIYVYGSWQFLTLLAAIFFLLLMSLQAFCSVYTCARVFHISNTTITS